jgi:hypothetical protein
MSTGAIAVAAAGRRAARVTVRGRINFGLVGTTTRPVSSADV